MDDFWLNLSLEIGLLALLGVLYYFYQKRKLLNYETNKIPDLMNFILQAALAEKSESSEQPELDKVIEAVDDYLKNEKNSAPLLQLKNFTNSPECSPELKEIILEALKEIEQ